MNYAFYLVFPFLLISSQMGPSPQFSLEEGLVAYYSFNRCDARDDSGGGSEGILYGNVGCWCGIEDDGLLFDGNQSFVTFTGAVNRYFTTSDFTLSFYFKPNQYTIFPQSMLSKRVECDEEHMLDIQLDQNLNQVDTDFHETPAKDFPELSPELSAAGWQHFVLVRRDFSAYTYINGELVRRSRRCSGVDISNEALLSFANSPCVDRGGARRFKGVLDELRVYDRPLSEAEVKALYQHFPIEKAEQDCFS
ncbi:MAG: LamG domain-containing protein [Bacteroidota bacterium]